jgi:signal transduction histidine kinase
MPPSLTVAVRRAWARGASVRARTTAGAAVAVAVALIVGAVAVSQLQRRALFENTDSALEQRADDLSGLLAGGSLPSVLGAGPDGPRRPTDETLAQILDPRGRVVAASANIAGSPPFAEGFAPAQEREFRTFDELPIDDDPFRVLAQRIELADGSYTVDESTAALNRIFVIGVPLMVALVGGVTWFFVGRALSPVEAMRAEVAGISSEELHRRVPEPAIDDEVGRLARTMNGMLERLDAAQQRQQRFVADASHELRSPLTNIRAQLEVDLARPEAAEPLETEQAVLEEAIRLERLVDDLMHLARGDVSAGLHLEAVDLDDIVFHELDRLRGRDSLTIDSSLVSGAQLEGDRDQLTRVVRNLLENAARHASSRITVALSEHEAAGELTLSIEDDGPGIPPDARERVFERFARLSESRSRDGGGVGLGLAITREIVSRHGGLVFVDPAYGEGARFVVRFPMPGAAADG